MPSTSVGNVNCCWRIHFRATVVIVYVKTACYILSGSDTDFSLWCKTVHYYTVMVHCSSLLVRCSSHPIDNICSLTDNKIGGKIVRAFQVSAWKENSTKSTAEKVKFMVSKCLNSEIHKIHEFHIKLPWMLSKICCVKSETLCSEQNCNVQETAVIGHSLMCVFWNVK